MAQSGNFGVNPPPPVDPRFVHLLARWESEVRSVQKQGWEAQKTAQEFAKLGLSSALLLNGGALLALPPLMQWLSFQGRQQVAVEAFWFLIGAGATAIAIIIAYLNWIIIKSEQYTLATKRARELDCEYIFKDVKDDEAHINAVNKLRQIAPAVDRTAIAAIAFALIAYASFGVGVFKFISLAEHNAIAPVKAQTNGAPIGLTPASHKSSPT